MSLLNMSTNNSLVAFQDSTNLTYISISEDLDSRINSSDIIYQNATTNITNVCPNISLIDFSPGTTIGFALVALIGLFLCFLGYKFLRTSVFIIAVIMFSGLVYIICCEVVASNLPPLVATGSSVLSGLLAGLISILLLSYFGSRVTSTFAGVVIATYLLVLMRIVFQFPLPVSDSLKESFVDVETATTYEDDNQTSNYLSRSTSDTESGLDWGKIFPVLVSLVLMIFCGCAMLVASFLRPKATLVSSTSVVGSAMVGLVVDFFTDRNMTLARVSLDCLAVKVTFLSHLCQVDRCCCCWTSWMVLGLVPILVLVSILVQWCCFSAGVEHELDKLGLVSCGSNQDTGVPVLMEPSEKYRHLYRIRRTNGDIISRTHMEAIEVRKSNPSLMLTTARSTSDIVTTTDDDATLVLTQILDE